MQELPTLVALCSLGVHTCVRVWTCVCGFVFLTVQAKSTPLMPFTSPPWLTLPRYRAVPRVCACVLPFAAEVGTYLRYCRQLDFYQEPDYAHLRQLWWDIFKREGYKVRPALALLGCVGLCMCVSVSVSLCLRLSLGSYLWSCCSVVRPLPIPALTVALI